MVGFDGDESYIGTFSVKKSPKKSIQDLGKLIMLWCSTLTLLRAFARHLVGTKMMIQGVRLSSSQFA